MCLSSPVLAKKKAGGGKRKKGKTAETMSKVSTASGSKPMGRRIGAGANVSPLGLGLGGLAFGGDFFLSPSETLDFFGNSLYGTTDLRKSIQSRFDSLVSVDTASFQAMQFLSGARYFVWSSLYISGSLGFRRLSGLLQFSSGNNYWDTEIAINSIMIGGGIGNRWYITESFFAGVEWIAFHIPIWSGASSSLDTNTEDPTGKATSEERSASVGDGLKKINSITVANFSAGISF